MSNTFKLIQANYGVHSSGTKFYEVAVFQRLSDSKMFQIRRYAKTAQASRGGATMIEAAVGTWTASDLVRTKTRGGYNFVSGATSGLFKSFKVGETYSQTNILAFYSGTSQQAEIRRMLLGSGDDEAVAVEYPSPGLKAAPIKKPEQASAVLPGWGAW